jgi:translation initiation factor 2 subunit 3
MRYKAEMKRNMTIKLGYASAKVYKCSGGGCARPGCYASCAAEEDITGMKCKSIGGGCEGRYEFVRRISFVDCPGHEVLVWTMLTGTSVMDAALVVISAEEECPQMQTREHFKAVEALGLRDVVVVQNKLDCVTPEVAAKHEKQIKTFLKGTVAEDAPVVPVSAQFGINIDAILDVLANIPSPVRKLDASPRMSIVRSFDVNRPGASISDLKGGIAGGTLLQGVLRLHDDIEIRHGLISRDSTTGKLTSTPLYSRVTSLSSDAEKLDAAEPGYLIGVGTLLAPEVCRSDRLVGQVLGLRGTLPPVLSSIVIHFELTRRTADNDDGCKAERIRKGEALIVKIGSATTKATVLKVKDSRMEMMLETPVCADVGEKLSISRRLDGRWRLTGCATLFSGVEASRKD